jgi:hypothetical protein
VPITAANPFKWRHYPGDIIMWCVRWYLRYPHLGGTNGGDDQGERSSHQPPLCVAIRWGGGESKPLAGFYLSLCPNGSPANLPSRAHSRRLRAAVTEEAKIQVSGAA